MLLKIIFVLVLIFTGLEFSLFNMADFYQSREVKSFDTRILLVIKLVLYVDTQCKYF